MLDPVVLIPGGGGATKTGVKNLIHVSTLAREGFTFQKPVVTDIGDKSHLCSAIASCVLNSVRFLRPRL